MKKSLLFVVGIFAVLGWLQAEPSFAADRQGVVKKKVVVQSKQSVKPSTGADEVGFNPQPEPPGRPVAMNSDPSSGLDEVGFNPQPEPPHDPFFARRNRGTVAKEVAE